MKNSKLVNKITNAYVMLIYVFVFIPVIVMVAFSFNSLPSNQHWESFTLDYYSKLFSDSEMIHTYKLTYTGSSKYACRYLYRHPWCICALQA